MSHQLAREQYLEDRLVTMDNNVFGMQWGFLPRDKVLIGLGSFKIQENLIRNELNVSFMRKISPQL
jgi:hypothetical protein